MVARIEHNILGSYTWHSWLEKKAHLVRRVDNHVFVLLLTALSIKLGSSVNAIAYQALFSIWRKRYLNE